MCISKARAIVRRGNTPTAKRASKDIFYWSCERSRMPDWSVIRMQANRHYCENFQLRGRRRSEEHTSELQSLRHLVCRLLLEKKKHLMTEKTTHTTKIKPNA